MEKTSAGAVHVVLPTVVNLVTIGVLAALSEASEERRTDAVVDKEGRRGGRRDVAGEIRIAYTTRNHICSIRISWTNHRCCVSARKERVRRTIINC